MRIIKLKNFSLSVRLFISFLLCLVGISYVMLLSSIWIDTEMKVVNIIEGYASFEFMELVEHTFRYIFWFIGTFTITILLFLLTSWPEKLKNSFAIAIPLLILSDMGSMWMIRYSNFFAIQLYVSGALLAASFLTLFVLIQWELWNGAFKKKDKRKIVSKKVAVVSEKILKLLDEADEPLNVETLVFQLHFEYPGEFIQMSLGWLVREGVVCAEHRNHGTYVVRSNSPIHHEKECHGTHLWISEDTPLN